MANANKALKDLIEEGKESGVLSLEDLSLIGLYTL